MREDVVFVQKHRGVTGVKRCSKAQKSEASFLGREGLSLRSSVVRRVYDDMRQSFLSLL